MTALIIVGLFALLLLLAGAALGASWQNKLNEGQRRRTASHRREMHTIRQSLENRATTIEFEWPDRRMVLPVAVHANDSD